MIVVQFIDHWKNYFAGDIAGFAPQVSTMLIEKEIAIKIETGEPKEEPKKGTKRNGKSN